MFPASVVVYFIITMSLWRDTFLKEVLRILFENINILSQGTATVVALASHLSLAQEQN
jgi:hypothetical protein